MFDHVKHVCDAIIGAGGKPYFVGGCVRDKVLGFEPKDIDIEVFCLEAEDLKDIVSQFGKVDEVGRSFGVLKLWLDDGVDVDISLPRKDSKSGNGHRGFDVKVNPMMGTFEASSRRDFTMNALMMDCDTGEMIDHHGGEIDINLGVIRHVDSDHFYEDPLRPLRAMQFSGRFVMKVHEQTADLCKVMFDGGDWRSLPVERVWSEWEKWAIKSPVPSYGLRALVDIGWISMFPEIESLVHLHQCPVWHPEGTVFNHTCHTVDKMEELLSEKGIAGDDKLVLMLAALCHDFGKVTTTAFEDGRIRSKGHAQAGEEPARSFLKRIGAPVSIVERVVPLVVEHMTCWDGKFSNRAVRRLANRLHPATIEELHLVVRADFMGRPPLDNDDPFEKLSVIAERLSVLRSKPKPILLGRHLIDRGVKPGPEMGKILREAFEEQLDGAFDGLDGALSWFNAKNEEN